MQVLLPVSPVPVWKLIPIPGSPNNAVAHVAARENKVVALYNIDVERITSQNIEKLAVQAESTKSHMYVYAYANENKSSEIDQKCANRFVGAPVLQCFDDVSYKFTNGGSLFLKLQSKLNASEIQRLKRNCDIVVDYEKDIINNSSKAESVSSGPLTDTSFKIFLQSIK